MLTATWLSQYSPKHTYYIDRMWFMLLRLRSSEFIKSEDYTTERGFQSVRFILRGTRLSMSNIKRKCPFTRFWMEIGQPPNGFGITLYHFAWVGILIKDQHYKYNLNSDHCGGLYVWFVNPETVSRDTCLRFIMLVVTSREIALTSSIIYSGRNSGTVTELKKNI